MSATSSPTPTAAPAPVAPGAAPASRTTRGLVLLGIGSVLTLSAMALLAVIIVGTATLQSDALARIANGTVTYRAEFGLIERKVSGLSALIAGPGILLVAAMCSSSPDTCAGAGTCTKCPPPA